MHPSHEQYKVLPVLRRRRVSSRAISYYNRPDPTKDSITFREPNNFTKTSPQGLAREVQTRLKDLAIIQGKFTESHPTTGSLETVDRPVFTISLWGYTPYYDPI